MTDKDIPSVPVTTLAGLTSLSDLLSELPVSDTLSFFTSLNKSLLFHPRVAEEANNLLAVRDENLLKPLVNAIEQTNSDNIELKEQFCDSDLNLASPTAPELLKAIYAHKPTVFSYRSQVEQQQKLQEQQLKQQQQPSIQETSSPFYHLTQSQLDSGLHNVESIDIASVSGTRSQTLAAQLPSTSNHIIDQSSFSELFNSIDSVPTVPTIDSLQHSLSVFESQQTTNHSNQMQTRHQIAQTRSQANASLVQTNNSILPSSFNNELRHRSGPGPGPGPGLGPGPLIEHQQPSPAQKLVPRNNEYLEQQQQRPSPAQASDAPDANHITTSFQQPTESSTNVYAAPKTALTNHNFDLATPKRKPMVVLNRFSEEDTALMQESLTKFAKKSPELAKKIGIDVESGDGGSLFSQMKADEQKSSVQGFKRKLNHQLEKEGELFSKPKLRRIEKKVHTPSKKQSKEELMNSATYQKFISVMEQICDQLDDTEAPSSMDDPEDNIECISSHLIASISSEAAKLKARDAIDVVPQNKLQPLINYAMRSVHLAKNFSAGPDIQEDLVGGECLEKIQNACEAALLVCNIYACHDVTFLQEDNVDAIIKFLQFQLRETIFPSYDAVYTVETKKKSDSRKKKNVGGSSGQSRSILHLYSKIVELTKILVTILSKFSFEDTIIIHASAVGVEPFFVDNIETLQFVCLDLVTIIFQNEKYAKHRSNILNDILSSIDRLHCSKRNLRPYKLANNSGNIQMVTALVLQLIQCAVVLPDALCTNGTGKRSKHNNDSKPKIEKDVFIIEKYDTALSIGGNFLTTFLSKCKSRSGETDFRPLFENFIHDLLTTVNKPEWPAAELLLSLLGTLLVKYMSDKSVEQSIRVVSLEYLGIVASRLRKDSVESRCKVNTMDQLIKCIKIEQQKEGDSQDNESMAELDPEEERTEFLQKMLLDFLAVNAQEENLVWDHARHFYLTLWYRDIMQRKKKVAEGEKGYASRKKRGYAKRKKYRGDSDLDDDDDDDESNEEEDNTRLKDIKSTIIDQELNLEIFRILEQRKKYLLTKIRTYSEHSVVASTQDIKTYIDYGNAQLIAQYLASKRSFSQSFDKYLQKIILVVNESSIAIRTKAMKCLANIVEVDPTILKRKDMQMGVNQKFLDTSISVREAAVDLIGKYVLSSPELIEQYYEMLSKRILDTGVSVRKRVIKIMRDICLVYPDFAKIPEMCVKMIRRVNDEEGIQKLVTEVFMNMWFTPSNEEDKISMERKISQITDVVSSSHDTGTQWLDGLLKSIFKPKENNDATKVAKEPPKALVTACQQLANGLVDAVLRLEGTDNKKLLGCITTLHLFAKIRPQLLVQHAITLEPYLNVKCHSTNVVKFMSCVAEILEQVVPLMEHPSDLFLADLEAHLMMLIVSHNQTVVLSCVSCLGAVVNKITKNYKLIRDCFSKYYFQSLANYRDKLVSNPSIPIEHVYRPPFRRSVYTVGLIMRYFDFKEPEVYGDGIMDGFSENVCDEVFDTLMYFVTCNNVDVRKDTLVALGYFCVKNYDFLTKPELKDFYRDLLTLDTVQTEMKTTVLRNVLMFLNEEDLRMDRNEKDWTTQAKNENLKEMCDQTSGMAARVIQLYIKDILNCFVMCDYSVRYWAMRAIEAVLQQGLVHPAQIVPYLICLSTDIEKDNGHCADRHLQEIDKQYPGFINMKSNSGIQLSFELQTMLQRNNDHRIIRGYRVKEQEEQPSALNGFLYSLLRATKPQRRALVQSITKQFDDQKTTLRQMLYLADNLAYFPYAVQDEPLYLIHQIDVLITVTGTNLLSSFKDGLKPNVQVAPVADSTTTVQPMNPLDEDDDDDRDVLFSRLPEDTSDLQICITAAQGCMLLLILKQHLKDCYGITDGKISRYSPSEAAKVYEKAMQRRAIGAFNPKSTIDVIKEENNIATVLTDSKKKELISRYLDFKQLMLKLDAEETDPEDDETGRLNKSNSRTESTHTQNQQHQQQQQQNQQQQQQHQQQQQQQNQYQQQPMAHNNTVASAHQQQFIESLSNSTQNMSLAMAPPMLPSSYPMNNMMNTQNMPPMMNRQNMAKDTSAAAANHTHAKSSSRGKSPRKPTATSAATTKKKKKKKVISSSEDESDLSDSDY